MFNTQKVAEVIRSARIKKNLTQMELADKMAVSFQAVSNLERANSMPDIGKIAELCQILDITYEQLFGSEGATAEIVKKIVDNEQEVSLEELTEVAPIVPPQKISQQVDKEFSGDNSIPIDKLVEIAPFVNNEVLDGAVMQNPEIDLASLSEIAPFLSDSTLNSIVTAKLKNNDFDLSEIHSFLPFLSQDSLQEIVKVKLKDDNFDFSQIHSLLPFLKHDALSHMVDCAVNKGRTSAYVDVLPFLESAEVAKLAFSSVERGVDVEEFLPFMEESDVAQLAVNLIKKGKSINSLYPFLDEKSLIELLTRKV